MNQDDFERSDATLRNAPPHDRRLHGLARALGWLSVALGAAELLAPRRVSHAAGVDTPANLVRGCGARELVTGAGLLSASRPEPWVWGRVAGDLLDIGTVMLAPAPSWSQRLRSGGTRAVLPVDRWASPGPASPLGGRGWALLALVAITAVDLACASALRQQRHARRARRRDWGGRSGWPQSPEQMRGAALADFTPPEDLRTPEALRPWSQDRGPLH